MILRKRTDTRAVDPWVVQVALSGLNQEDLEVVVEVCQTGRSQQLSSQVEGTLPIGEGTDRPATTQPQLPPPHTMISTSSGTVIFTTVEYEMY
jgi:hypothetical protein